MCKRQQGQQTSIARAVVTEAFYIKEKYYFRDRWRLKVTNVKQFAIYYGLLYCSCLFMLISCFVLLYYNVIQCFHDITFHFHCVV